MSSKPTKRGSAPAPEVRVIHEIDGIQELDNNLPNWWLWTLYGAIAFGAVYWVHYEILKTGRSPNDEYMQEMAQVAESKAKESASLGEVTVEALDALAKNGSAVEKGKTLYTQNCAACHAPNGGGGIGPNLTDHHWIHGGAADKVYETVKHGVTAKGMPAWGPALGEENVRATVAYVLTLRGTDVAGGKAPQGEKEP
jgi:cytochrome c oxidase cbb3-type subunit 3